MTPKALPFHYKMFGLPAYIFVACLSVSMLSVECAKILAVFPYPGPAQYLPAHLYLRQLALRGHNITLIVNPIQFVDFSLFREIRVNFQGFDELVAANVQGKELSQRRLMCHFHTNVTTMVLENPQIKAMMQDSNVTFDMVIIDTLMPSALYALGRHFKAHLVGISAGPAEQQVDNLVGNNSPVSFVPLFSTGMESGPMNFGDRVQNLGQALIEWLWIYIREWSVQRGLYLKYFPHLESTLGEISGNFSLVLLNQHYSIGVPRPYTPNMIEVGGMYITEKAEPLPKDILDFINEAKNGVIYFSMGSNIQLRTFGEKQFEAMLDFFHDLKMRVLWKFESPEMNGVPENVLVRKWFPQRAVLAHPNVKLFITQGGFLSVMEAVFHGIPVVGIPVFHDHIVNLRRVEQFGMGVILPYKQLSGMNISIACKEVLTKEFYVKNAKIMQKRFKDRPMKPLKTAVFWTEYILRHNGAEFLRVPAKDMTFIEYYNLDILGILLTFVCFHLGIIIELLRRCGTSLYRIHQDYQGRRQLSLSPQQVQFIEEELQRRQREQDYQDQQRVERQQELERERERKQQEQQQQQQQAQQRHAHHHKRGRRRR